jgi:hypothetical protein
MKIRYIKAITEDDDDDDNNNKNCLLFLRELFCVVLPYVLIVNTGVVNPTRNQRGTKFYRISIDFVILYVVIIIKLRRARYAEHVTRWRGVGCKRRTEF